MARTVMSGLLPQPRSLHLPQMVHFERMPARQAKFAEPARPLSAASRRALDARGVKSLFVHQAQVWTQRTGKWLFRHARGSRPVQHALPTNRDAVFREQSRI